MTTVSFIGSTLKYDAATAWPTSLTLTESDIPAGTQVGDRLVLYVMTVGMPSTFANLGISADWQTLQLFAGSGISGRPNLHIFTARYGVAGVLDQTIRPQQSNGTSTASGDSWDFVVCSFTPSRAFVSLHTETNFNVVPGSTRPAPFAGYDANTDEYLQQAICFATGSPTFIGGNVGIPATPWVSRHLGGVWHPSAVADVTTPSTFSGANYAYYGSISRTTTTVVNFSSTDEEPLRPSWSIGRIAY
jgi:hypothetical protein